MKIVILAGGTGQRLKPITSYINKHLLPIYNKPMIFFPISFAILIGASQILIICSDNESKKKYKKILDPFKVKIKFHYKIQKKASGIPDAMSYGEKFLKNQDQKIYILGDNFFYGHSLIQNIKSQLDKKKPTIFLKKVDNPSSFGVARLYKNQITKIEEKPKKNTNNLFAIAGLYFFDENLFKKIKKLKLSKRKEYEITDIIKIYKKEKNLNFYNLGRGSVWYDLGNFDNINNCSNLVSIFQKRNDLEIGSLNEILGK
tara:strand:+ start:204 stop:977 length:774 start_codon:yes stop_codon:yes gene_type:complete